MEIKEFMEKYNIAVFVKIKNSDNMEIIRSETNKMQSDVLFDQLITFRDVQSIIDTVVDQTLPRTWAQDTTRCIITKNSDFVIYVFYESKLDAFDNYDMSMKINDELMNIKI